MLEASIDGAAMPVQRRKRGDELRAAVHSAVLDELRERGFAALTMDAVAARARTGKATLYRHWPGKVELVVDAFCSSMPPIETPEDDGDVRGQLLSVLRQVAGAVQSPIGTVALGLIVELARSPELVDTLRMRTGDPVVGPIMEILRRAAVRGQVPASALTPRVAAVGPDLLKSHALINGGRIPDAVVVEIVDLVLMPLLRGYAAS